MTLKKKGERSRAYDTFESSEAADSSPSTKSPLKDSQNRSAGLEAQRLATQGLWSENYINRTPLSNRSEMGNEAEGLQVYQDDPNDPPPIYTPADSTAPSSSAPPSPVVPRSQPQPVGDPQSPTSVSYPALQEETEEEAAAESFSSSPLLERAESQTPSQPPEHRRSCGWRRDRRRRECGRREPHKHGRKRFRKACWFSCALALCLWLMFTTMLRNNAHTHGPGWHHQPKDPLDESPVPSWPIPQREYRQHETSRPITGTFKLYDLLDLSTTSGSISINVEPQAGDKSAKMNIRSTSGTVHINMGTGILPWLPSSSETNRTFETTINTQSGAVTGSLVAGNGGTTYIETQSGSITLTVHALDSHHKDQPSRLATRSQSGAQVLNVASSSGHELRSWIAHHVAMGSASLKLDYPRKWVGKLHMKSFGSGSMHASGSNLHFEQDSSREKYAWRGEGALQEVEILAQGSGSAVFSC